MTDFARNKKALHDFNIEETYEAGIALTGPEVKSVARAGPTSRRATRGCGTARCS